MLQFSIRVDSEIPASKQLFDQIQFAIASRQCPPGHRLPSTRQLAIMTGLHRNTISKVYRQLEECGLVESIAGSGIYVKERGQEDIGSPLLAQYPQGKRIIRKTIDDLLSQGCTLAQAKELFIAEIDWRLYSSAIVLLTVPSRDIGAGKLMVNELEQSLGIPVQLVLLEELLDVLERTDSGTIVTSHYFIREVLELVNTQIFRVIPIDIYDYSKELEIVKNLPKNSCLGMVSLSAGTLSIAEIIIHGLRGNDILVMTAQINDGYKLQGLIGRAHTIICDAPSYPLVKRAVVAMSEGLIRRPAVIASQNYVSVDSINLLKRELGLT
jgi:GntR family transcriptional regulator